MISGNHIGRLSQLTGPKLLLPSKRQTYYRSGIPLRLVPSLPHTLFSISSITYQRNSKKRRRYVISRMSCGTSIVCQRSKNRRGTRFFKITSQDVKTCLSQLDKIWHRNCKNIWRTRTLKTKNRRNRE